jgi:ribosomal peptide maturation radical SAM protein 1
MIHDNQSVLPRPAPATVLSSDVLLVNMPFTNLFTPSIGLGLLKAGLTRIGVSCRALDFHLRFAELVGQDTYHSIEGKTYPEHLVGEWVFSESLFQHPKNSDLENYVREVLEVHTVDVPDEPIYSRAFLDELVGAIPKAKAKVEDFLDECLHTVLSHKPRIVGFTSMFEQHLAALSLAKRLKSHRPDCCIVFGGSNCEGMMGTETFRQFDFIDVLVSGEGDSVFPEIVRSVLASKPLPAFQGVSYRQRQALQLADQPPQNTPMIREMDKLPIPDYDDYFEQLRASSLKHTKKPILLFETSRGCWWGEKLHCTFCGLNGATMAYRSKSAERAMDELLYLTDRHPGCGINAVDNILDMKYFKTLMKLLAEGKYDFGLFYEVKANLKKDQLRLLRDAGISTIQPGIESLSDNVLRIMRKGVTAMQNIQLLKWCAELNMKVIYNIIWGFPGESPDDYTKMINLIPLLTHLRPPVGAGTIRIDRFSPNFNTHRQLGFGELSPFPAYQYVYPLDPEAVFNLAYYFVPEYETLVPESFNIRGLTYEIRNWKQTYERSELFFMDKGSQLLIWDLRPCAKEPLVILDEHDRLVYMACDESRTRQQIRDIWCRTSPLPLDEIRLKDTLDTLVEQTLMIREGEQYLSLAYQKSA